jgi:hypothetical protein
MKARRLITSNTNAIEKYITFTTREFKKHNLLNRLKALYINHILGKIVDIQEFEQIDQLLTNIVIRAEKKCRKLKTGEVPYVPTHVQKYGQ